MYILLCECIPHFLYSKPIYGEIVSKLFIAFFQKKPFYGKFSVMSSTNADEAADSALLVKLDNLKMGSGDGDDSPKEEPKGKMSGRRYRKKDVSFAL